MTEQQLRAANGSSLHVEWRGLRDWERVTGTITALLFRRNNGVETLSVEITDVYSKNSKMLCRPEDIYPLGTADEWKSILGG